MPSSYRAPKPPRMTYDQVARRVTYLRQLADPFMTPRARIRALCDGGAAAIDVLLKGLDTNDDTELAVNHIKSGIERFSEMISPPPDLRIDPPEHMENDRAARKAEKRERIVNSYDEQCNLEGQLEQASLWLPGYGFFAWRVREARDSNGYYYPKAELRDPYACVDTETEVLTKRGWLRHDEITEDDIVAGYDLDAGMARWTEIHGITRHENYDDTIVSVDQRDMSMRLTKGHRCVVAERRRDGTRGEVKIKFAEDLRANEFIPRAADWIDDPEKSIGVDLAALIGWVAAEGTYTGRDTVTLCQSVSANPEKVEVIDGLIERLADIYPSDRNGRVNLCKSLLTVHRTERDRVGRGGEHRMAEWRLPLGLGQEIRRIMPEKQIGMWAIDLPAVEREALLQAFIDADGTRPSKDRASIIQNDGETINSLHAVAVTLGYKASLRPRGSTMSLALSRKRWTQMRTRSVESNGLSVQHHKGLMWCPTTGTGTFFARREGYVFITGNTWPGPWGVDQQPQDIAFLTLHDPADVIARYPKAEAALKGRGSRLPGGAYDLSSITPGANSGRPGWDGATGGVEIIEYVDGYGVYVYSPAVGELLDVYPLPTSRPGFVVAKRPSFNMQRGQFDDAIGAASAIAKATLLQRIAMEDAVFAPLVITGRHDGPVEKGRDSVIHIDGGDAKYLYQNIPYQAFQEVERIEGYLRSMTGYSKQADGESPISFVTGQGLEELGSSLSRQVERNQSVLRRALETLDSIRLEWDETAYGGQSKPLEGVRKGATYSEEYDPATDIGGHWRTRRVYGLMSGLDDARRGVALLQYLGAGVIDDETVQEQVRGIDNPQKVRDRLVSKQARDALLASMAARQQAGDPQADAAMLAIKKDPRNFDKVLEEFFAAPEPEPEVALPESPPPLSEAMALMGGGGADVLTRLTANGQPSGGVQTEREVA